MLNYYINNSGEQTATGSIIVIEVTDATLNKIRYYIHEMHIDFFNGIRLTGYKKVKPNGIDNEYIDSAIELTVTNNTYRKLSDLTVHTSATALNEDGSLKAGFIGEFDLFVQMFGHNVSGTVNAIYPFIIDAIQRKYSLV